MSTVRMARFTPPEQKRSDTQESPPAARSAPLPALQENGNSAPASPSGIERLLTSKEASEVLKIHPKVLERMAKRGEVPALKVGKFWRYRASALNAWINSRLQSGRQPCHMETSF